MVFNLGEIRTDTSQLPTTTTPSAEAIIIFQRGVSFPPTLFFIFVLRDSIAAFRASGGSRAAMNNGTKTLPLVDNVAYFLSASFPSGTIDNTVVDREHDLSRGRNVPRHRCLQLLGSRKTLAGRLTILRCNLKQSLRNNCCQSDRMLAL